jgi:hypothetical protein
MNAKTLGGNINDAVMAAYYLSISDLTGFKRIDRHLIPRQPSPAPERWIPGDEHPGHQCLLHHGA